ncbi:hypothetical protein RFF05_00700 [Bengtsoniella intestinalis]|uniref:hypothetical protein n=1 Tax=Bengtsoniella intestinalis TaxID=3073143 RepID=UPI00391F6FB5
MHVKLMVGCVLALMLSGCGAEESTSTLMDSATQVPTVEDVLTTGTQESTAEITPEVAVETADEGFGSYGSVEIDLTAMNSTLVYSQVYAMMLYPEDYAGRTVKMHGMFAYYYVESVDTYYYGIIVEDATACCAQGIEFVLADQEAYTCPDDYPQMGEYATVVGVFNSFTPEETPEYQYFHLEQAEFITE